MGLAPSLAHKYLTRVKVIVSRVAPSFTSIGHYYKTLRIRIVWQIDKFLSKQVFYIFYSIALALTNTLAYNGIRTIRFLNVFIVTGPRMKLTVSRVGT